MRVRFLLCIGSGSDIMNMFGGFGILRQLICS